VMRCAGHVARVGEMNMKFRSENLKGRERERERSLEGTLCRGKGYLRMDLRNNRLGRCGLDASGTG